MTTPADPNTRAPEEVLVHGSPDRTIISRRDGPGPRRLWKILEAGSPLDAEREVAFGRQLEGMGVVRYLEARAEPGSGRPVVVMDHHDGQDLEDLFSRMGALEPSLALRITARVAAIAHRLHTASIESAPRGLVHGDIKPSNVLCDATRLDEDDAVLLLDLEHACPLGGADREGFSGGTRGFAPPEADRGAAPTAAFDVYAIGATLQALLTGQHPTRADRSQLAAMPHGVASLIDASMAPDPADRPSAEALARECRELADQPEDPLDRVLALLQQGDVDLARAALAEADPEHDGDHRGSVRSLALRAWIQEADESAPEIPAAIGPMPGGELSHRLLVHGRQIAATARACEARLRRFPRCRPSLGRRRECRQATAVVLAELPKALLHLEREADFDHARDLLDVGRETVEAILAHPGSFSIPGVSPRLLNPLQRSPLQFLDRAERALAAAADDHNRTLGMLREAERELDLEQMESIIDEIAREGGGARMVVATLRDRVHRLGFYLDRFAAQREPLSQFVESLGQAGEGVDLAPAIAFAERCAARAPGLLREREADRGVDLRRLRRAFDDLHDEFADVDTRDARTSIAGTMATLTRRAWESLDKAREQLTSVPVPVRPLQAAMAQLDLWSMSGVFVDLPDRARDDLLDALERVRLDVERARATRDRMASGAEDAIARGHWTTALYDMERAVEQFSAEGEDNDLDEAGSDLNQRVEEVKRRKAEIEQVMRRNVALASEYTALLDSDEGTTEARLELLEARRTALQFLVDQLQEDRGQRYRQDLREVEVMMVQEHAARAERDLDASDDPAEWARLARQTLALIDAPMARGGGNAGGRIQRMAAHWRHRLEDAERELKRRRDEAASTVRSESRRRWMRLGTIAAVALLGFGIWQFGDRVAGFVVAAEPRDKSLADALATADRASMAELVALGERLRANDETLGEDLAARAAGLAPAAADLAAAEAVDEAQAAFAARLSDYRGMLQARRAALNTGLAEGLDAFGRAVEALARRIVDNRQR